MLRFQLTDCSEILSKTVSDEDTAKVDQQTKLFVRDLERNKRVRRAGWIQITAYLTISKVDIIQPRVHSLLIPEYSVR